jgi:hypothetical protein
VPVEVPSNNPSVPQVDGNTGSGSASSDPSSQPQKPVKKSMISSMFRSRTPSPNAKLAASASTGIAMKADDKAVDVVANDVQPTSDIPPTSAQTTLTADVKPPSKGKSKMFGRPPKADAAQPEAAKDPKKTGFLSSMFGSRSRSPSPNPSSNLAPVAMPSQPNPNQAPVDEKANDAPAQPSAQQPTNEPDVTAPSATPNLLDRDAKNVLPSLNKMDVIPSESISSDSKLQSPPTDMIAFPLISPKPSGGLNINSSLASNEDLQNVQRQGSPKEAAQTLSASEKPNKSTIETSTETSSTRATGPSIGRPPRTPTRQSPKPSPKLSSATDDVPANMNESQAASSAAAIAILSPKSPGPTAAEGDAEAMASPFPQLVSSISPQGSPSNHVSSSPVVNAEIKQLSPKPQPITAELANQSQPTVASPKPSTPAKKAYTIDTLEETLSELYRRLRLIGGLVGQDAEKPSRNLYEEMIILFEGLEIQIRGKITGHADQDDFSEVLNHLGVFDEKLGLALREAIIREIFSSYAQGAEFVDYELFCSQLLSAADPKLLLSNRSDADIYEIFLSAMNGLFDMKRPIPGSMTPIKALKAFYVYGSDSAQDLLAFDPVPDPERKESRVQNDKDHLISWFSRLVQQAAPSLTAEESLRLYSLLSSSCEAIPRATILEILSSDSDPDEQIKKQILELLSLRKTKNPSLLQPMAFPRQASSSSAAARQVAAESIYPATFAMDVIRAIQFDPIRPNRNQAKKSAELDEELYGSIHGARRKKALREGRVGGKPIPPKPSPEEAAIKIESCWRSKRVRRKLRRQNIAASMIQELVRRIQAKRRAKAQVIRIKIYEKEERERMYRQARIWKQERELMILRQLPIDDFLHYDKLKQENSARVIQRFWRGVVQLSSVVGSGIANRIILRQSYSSRPKDDNQELHEESVKLTQELYQMMKTARESSVSQAKADELLSKELKEDEPMTALHLAGLQKRIAEQARSKRSDQEELRMRRGLRPTLKVDDAEGEDDPIYKQSTSKAQLRRRKYEELISLQNMSSIMLKEYIDDKVKLVERLTARKQRMDHVEKLLEELTHLPSLDSPSATLTHWMATMSEKESNPNAIRSAASRHLQTIQAMRNLQLISDQDKSKYRRWSIVASPYDTLLPPIDITSPPFQSSYEAITQLSAKNTNFSSGAQLAEDWLSGKDAEESLWWVAYACQPPTYLGDGLHDPTYHDENDHTEANISASSDRMLVQKLLGSVNRQDLLDRLCRENILSSQRKERINKILKAEELKLEQKSELYERQVITKQVLAKHRSVEAKVAKPSLKNNQRQEAEAAASSTQLQSILSKPSSSRLASQASSKSVSIYVPAADELMLKESTHTISRETIQTTSSIEIDGLQIDSYETPSRSKRSPEKKPSPERRSAEQKTADEPVGDINSIMAKVFDRILDNRKLISKAIINEAISTADITQFRKAFVYPIFVALVNIAGGVQPILQYLAQASKAVTPPIEIDIHVVGIMLAELCIELNIIRPRTPSSPAESPGRSKRSPSRAQGRDMVWQMEIMQIGFFLRLLAALETIHDLPSSPSLPSSPGGDSDGHIPSVDIRGNLAAILQDLMMLHSSVAEDLLSHDRCAALLQQLCITRSMLAVKAYRNKASREQVLLSMLHSSMMRLADSNGLVEDDVLGIFIRVADIRLSVEENQYLRSYMLSQPASLGSLKELLCRLPATLHQRQLQIKFQIILNALPHLINDITTYFAQDAAASFTAQPLSNKERANRAYSRDIQHALWKSDCILSQAEIYTIAHLLERARVVVGLDLGAALTRIKQGQFLAAILSS